ncbi:hypothetical protein SLEP1_g52133 [Rubroshorea leprosula]|uniref:Uncharacterized protein n=1 Tax=Rubroshorea leprosula TaxID=152421 RepID=A0AAV5M676_9ROSI|nr:hypothetical protein SLEP1_g52133 [Rubroshorea leprosula]
MPSPAQLSEQAFLSHSFNINQAAYLPSRTYFFNSATFLPMQEKNWDSQITLT